MKPIRLTALFIMPILFLNGCFLKSVHPLITSKEAIILNGLEGSWEKEDEKWTFIIDPQSIPGIEFDVFDADFDVEIPLEPDYLIIYENFEDIEKDTTLFVGHVGKLGEYYYLDLSLFRSGIRTGNLKEAHLFTVHTFSKISISDKMLSIEFFKDSWIRDLILNNKVRIAHERIRDPIDDFDEDIDILITASTPELQKFVKKYSSDSEAFDGPIELKRSNREF